MHSTLPEYTSRNELLPKYTSSINLHGFALLKIEFLTPYQCNNGNRSWKPVLLQINSTQLNIYNINADKKLKELLVILYFELNSLKQLTADINTEYKKNNGVDFNSSQSEPDDFFSEDAYAGIRKDNPFSESKFGKLKNKFKTQKNHKILSTITNYYDILKDNQLLFEPTSGDIKGTTFEKLKGSLLHSYSLAHLQVGEAPSLNQLISAMYKEDHSSSTSNISSLVKYKNSLRLRIEYKQVLLQFWSFHGMARWFRTMTIGKDLSSPLESRTVTNFKSIPSSFNRRNNTLLAATAAAATYNRKRHYSHEVDNNTIQSFKDEQRTYKDRSAYVINTEDEEDSSFDNAQQYARPESILSSISSVEKTGYVNINGFKFVSNENAYTTLEKQYISNCVPDLNSFDKWNGNLMTISNAEFFVKDGSGNNESDNTFIGYNILGDMVQRFDRKSCNLNEQNKSSHTRTFLIQRDGLAEVKQDE
ncbi:hypothetical protein FOB58_001059 [Candida parapsilosis]|uniref:Uncharacterized protein n=2 Tax=Candida parapsilosis TaxID=5480 RepID=G8BFS9_CANPC|nr:uncharacterized protein CPAR2_203560 [Candida parapsilosis]KAF6055137.1 hypothetical protein FOB58_001059 [Candida parapsilosis]KAF6055840.1 hypothetical protein FOB59_000352 [Candida parapsilosis]KAF6058770.1 hypothetical protein FOB60_000352 [Candida parapsilosis]KAF6067527.1 hypothetical protein FOB61_000352 [Candida parapsilosis]KAI5909017.1 hypothetical protein K4G61_g2705 [Candida parapsilosis]